MFHSNASSDYMDHSSTHASINDTRNNSICRLIPFMGHHDVTRVKMTCFFMCVVGVVVVAPKNVFVVGRRTYRSFGTYPEEYLFRALVTTCQLPLVDGAASALIVISRTLR